MVCPDEHCSRHDGRIGHQGDLGRGDQVDVRDDVGESVESRQNHYEPPELETDTRPIRITGRYLTMLVCVCQHIS